MKHQVNQPNIEDALKVMADALIEIHRSMCSPEDCKDFNPTPIAHDALKSVFGETRPSKGRKLGTISSMLSIYLDEKRPKVISEHELEGARREIVTLKEVIRDHVMFQENWIPVDSRAVAEQIARELSQ